MATVITGFRAIGVCLEAPAEILAELQEHLPPFFTPQSAAVVSGRLVVDGDLLSVELPEGLGFTGQTGPETFRACASRIELALVAQLADAVVLHAGVVVFDGRAVVLPATSMAGKSTMVRALVAAGGRYFSDEFALIGADGRVSPYPRRITMRVSTGTERIDLPGAAEIDAESAPIGLVALLRFSPDGLVVRDATPADALLGMVENSVNVRSAPEFGLRVLSAAVASAACICGTRGEADEAAELIRERVERHA